jgi:hypothetical protein
MTDIKAVEFDCEIRQVKTMADKTVNVTMNLPEYCKEQAKIFMDWQGEMAHLIAEKIERDKDKGNWNKT